MAKIVKMWNKDKKKLFNKLEEFKTNLRLAKLIKIHIMVIARIYIVMNTKRCRTYSLHDESRW